MRRITAQLGDHVPHRLLLQGIHKGFTKYTLYAGWGVTELYELLYGLLYGIYTQRQLYFPGEK